LDEIRRLSISTTNNCAPIVSALTIETQKDRDTERQRYRETERQRDTQT